MKKNLYFLLVLFLVCLPAFSGCGGSATTEKAPSVRTGSGQDLTGQLAGHWDLYGFLEEDQLSPAGYLYENTVGMNLHIHEDGSAWWYNGLEIHRVTLDFEGKDGTFGVTFPEDGSRMVFLYDEARQQILLELEAGTVILARNQELAELLTGTWAGVKNGSLYTLELHADRTFSVTGEAGLAGTWHLRPVTAVGDDRYAGLDLMYDRDGETEIQSISLPAGPEDAPADISLVSTEFTMSLGEQEVPFCKKSPEDLQLTASLLEEGSVLLPGRWTSTAVMSREAGIVIRQVSHAYTVDFAADGSFTGYLNRDRAGSWHFDRLDVTGGIPTYTYLLTFDGGGETALCSLTAEGDSHLLTVTESRPIDPRSVSFQKLTPEALAELTSAEKEAQILLTGRWTSGSTRFQDGDGPVINEIDTGYTVSFRNDGTFTTNIAQGTAGSWSVSEITPLDHSGTALYTYNFRPDGFDGAVSCTCLEGSLSITLYFNGIRHQYNFGRYTGDELANIRNVPTLLEGTWHAEDIFRLNRDTGRFEFLRKESHTVTMASDGTFRSTLEGEETGIWCFSHYTPGYGYCFLSGDPDSSISTMDMMETGTLDIALEKDGEIYAISMTKE